MLKLVCIFFLFFWCRIPFLFFCSFCCLFSSGLKFVCCFFLYWPCKTKQKKVINVELSWAEPSKAELMRKGKQMLNDQNGSHTSNNHRFRFFFPFVMFILRFQIEILYFKELNALTGCRANCVLRLIFGAEHKFIYTMLFYIAIFFFSYIFLLFISVCLFFTLTLWQDRHLFFALLGRLSKTV